MSTFPARLQTAFSVDLRSLALFRVLAALAVLFNVFTLWPETNVWLTDHGLNTRSEAVSRLTPHHLSLYYLSGAAWYSHLLLTATAMAAIAMLLGWRTRLTTIVTWILVVSLTNRIPILTSGADMQLCLLLFWAMFLPVGARFSVDSALSTAPRQPASYFSIATVALLLQVAYLYFFGALLKTGAPWRETFDAIYYATSALEVTKPLAMYLAQYPDVARALTIYVFVLELLAIAFLFSPFRNDHARLFVLPQLIVMHLGFAVFLAIGVFPLVSISGLVAFIPALFWDRTLAWWNGRKSRRDIAIFYDRDCGFCLKTCLIFRELGLPPETTIQPAQDDAQAHALLQRENSWVVRTHDGRMLTRWPAVAYVWRRSPLFWLPGVLSLIPGFKQFGNWLYTRIAESRPALGRFSARWLPWRESVVFQPLRATSIALGFLVGLVILWNVDTLRSDRINFYFPDELRPLMRATRLTQTWNMFAPQPISVSRWVTIGAHAGEAEPTDLLFSRNRPLSDARPAHGLQAFPNERWRKYYSRIKFDAEAARLGAFYCTRASERGLASAGTIQISRYTQRVAPPGAADTPVHLPDHHVYDCAANTLVPASGQVASAMQDADESPDELEGGESGTILRATLR